MLLSRCIILTSHHLATCQQAKGKAKLISWFNVGFVPLIWRKGVKIQTSHITSCIKLWLWPRLCLFSGGNHLVFGYKCFRQQDEYCLAKLLPSLPFSLLPAIKSLLCSNLPLLTASSPPPQDEIKAEHVYVPVKQQFIQNGAQNAFFFFLRCCSCSSYGREHCLKKIVFFSP